MAPLAPDAPLWAVANESRHWSAADLALLKADHGALPSLLRVPKGKQRRLLTADASKRSPTQRPARPPLDASDLEARIAEAEEELHAMRLSGIVPVPLFSDGYPARLEKIANPPLLLYLLGMLNSFDACIAISGTRTPTLWGVRTSQRLGRRLAEREWVVTSGLAKGVDTAAHRGALSVEGGTTVAVSALPLDRVYPHENLELAREIIDLGAIVTEHGLADGIGSVEFIRRNRIISGLSFAQFIIETSGGGGTWSQATTAKEQGRPLFAMRPPRTEAKAWRGFEALLELGAVACSSVEDALREADEIWAAIAE